MGEDEGGRDREEGETESVICLLLFVGGVVDLITVGGWWASSPLVGGEHSSPLVVLGTHCHLWVVFKGSVQWTEKMTKTKLNATKSNQTVSCGCPISRSFVIGLVQLNRYLKTVQRPVAISCNQSLSWYI